MFSLFKSKPRKDIKVEESQVIEEVSPITSCSVQRKEHLMVKMSEKIGAAQKDIAVVYEALVKIVEEELAKNGEIRLSGLGKLITKEVRAREYYNMKTHKKYMGKARQVVRFRAAYNIKQAVEDAAKEKEKSKAEAAMPKAAKKVAKKAAKKSKKK